MKLVVDTDVIAAVVLGEPRAGEGAARLLAGSWDLMAPDHWKAELCNVIGKAVRLGGLSPERAGESLTLAAALPIESVDVAELWGGALGRAIEAGHPAYDTLFIELAARNQTVVASYDRQLRRRFPEYVREPEEVLGHGIGD